MYMKQGSTLFLKIVLLIIGLVALTLCFLIFPLGIMSDTTGLYRPIIVGLYLPAVPFFYALYQAFKLLSYIDKSVAFSELSVQALKNIKYCAVVIAGIFTAGMPYIFYAGDRDDAPGVVALGLVIIFVSIVIATFAAVLQKLIQSGVEIKSENDLTV